MEDCDLSAIDWRDLPNARVVARGCRIAEGHLIDAQLPESELEQCSFLRCSFASADLSGAVFRNCTFFDPESRRGSDFSFADLGSATFENCNLSTCKFGSANLHAVQIRGCKAAGVDFELASFTRKVGRTGLTAGTLIDSMLDIASFREVVLNGCDLSRSSLRGTDFAGAALAEAHFRNCELSGAVMSAARLDRADMRGAILDDVDLGSAASYAGIKVSQSQLPALAAKLGIRVFPD